MDVALKSPAAEPTELSLEGPQVHATLPAAAPNAGCGSFLPDGKLTHLTGLWLKDFPLAQPNVLELH